MTFDEYIDKNYEELLQIAGRIYRGCNLEPSEILAEMYLQIREKAHQIKPTQDDYKYFCVRWLQNSLKWTGGNPIKKLRIKEPLHPETVARFFENIEADNLEGNETIKDLIRAGMTRDQAERIEICIIQSKRLPLAPYRLFELHYLEGYSLQEIADSCNLPKTAIFRDKESMLQQLRKRVKNELSK